MGSNVALREELELLPSKIAENDIRDTCFRTKIQTIDDSIECQQSMDVIMSLPEFDVRINSYVSWRVIAHNSMSLYVKRSKK